MTNPNYPEQVEKILMRISMPGLETPDDISIDQATKALCDLFVESISKKDWHTCFDQDSCDRSCRGMIRNELRAELRQKWSVE